MFDDLSGEDPSQRTVGLRVQVLKCIRTFDIMPFRPTPVHH
jgi:hypothetical protein